MIKQCFNCNHKFEPQRTESYCYHCINSAYRIIRDSNENGYDVGKQPTEPIWKDWENND